MDPNPTSFPILSYVMARLAPKPSSSSSAPEFDIEQPPPQSTPILTQLPRLTDPKLLASMARSVSDVAHTRSVLQALGPRPDHETVDMARLKLSEIESSLSEQLEEIVLSPRSPGVERLGWRSHLEDKEQKCRQDAEREKGIYKTVMQLDEMHAEYEKLLKEAEARLVRIYDKASRGDQVEEEERTEIVEEVNKEVVGILRAASGAEGLERVDLSDRKLRFLPEAFGRIRGLKVLDLSNNQLQMIPDSISGLENLEELNLSSNILEALPDSIGLLYNLKILDVSGNKLEAIPDTICHCKSLVELDLSFNHLAYLPTNIGYELVSLRRLSIQLNKIPTLPTSIGEMRSLCHLDAHFNSLSVLPLSIGRLTNLEILNLSSNFSDLTKLPDTFGDLTNLKELDLSNNQIHALPDTFGRLDNLSKLNLDQNPLVIPPMEVVMLGVEAVKIFMTKRWLDILLEEERKSILEVQEQAETGWLTRSSSWLKQYVSETVSGYLGPRTPRDPYLDQQL